MTTTYYNPSRRPGPLAALRDFLFRLFGTSGVSPTASVVSASQLGVAVDRDAADPDLSRNQDHVGNNEGSRGGNLMVFRKESRHDSFQRQISALRQQLSADSGDDEDADEQQSGPIRMSPPDDAERWQSVEHEEQPLPVEPSGSAAETGVISSGSSWTGTITTSGSVHVFGSLDGEILASADVYVAEGATVDARVEATNVIVAGQLGGTITCRGRLEVWPSGHVTGEVSAPSLVIHEGATVDGTVAMRQNGATT